MKLLQRFLPLWLQMGVISCVTTQSASLHVEPEDLTKTRPLLRKPVQITVGNDANLSPDLSRDGRYLVYTTSINGNKEVVYRDRLKGKQTRMTWHPADDYSPVLNADASKIAFLTRRQDAAGDLAVVSTSVFTSGIVSERSIDVAFRSETEELPPVWWPDGKSILVATRSVNSKAPKLRIYYLDSKKWLDWADNYGEFPTISSDAQRVSYVREGRIYINSADGHSEHALENMPKGIWSRPKFIENATAMVAIRYHHDTNQDGRIDGFDNGTVWRLDCDGGYKTVLKAQQLTAANYNAYVPELRSDGLFVTLQAKGALEIFKFPSDGQGRDIWLELPEQRWLDSIVSVHERFFAMKTTAAKLRGKGPGHARKAALLDIRALRELTKLGSPDVELASEDLKDAYPGDESIRLVTEAVKLEARVQADIDATKSGKSGRSSRERIQLTLEKLESLGVSANAIKASMVSPADTKAIILNTKANLLSQIHRYQDALGTLERIGQEGVNQRYLDESKLIAADIAGATKGPLSKEASLRDILSNTSTPSDILRKAADQMLVTVDTRDPSNDELTVLRQQVAKLPLLPALLHELTARRFLKSNKLNIAIQEYRQILQDHCKEDPAVTLQLAATYVDIGVTDAQSDEVDRSLAQMAECIQNVDVESSELAVLRANAMVKRGLILMKEREYGAALKIFRSAVHLDPDNLAGWRGVVEASFYRKIISEVTAELETNYQRNLGKASAAYAYGYALTYQIDLSSSPSAKIGAIDRSLVLIEKAKDLNPSSIFPYQTLGWLHMQKGHWTKRLRGQGGLIGTASSLFAKTRELFGRPEEDQIELGIDAFLAALYLADDQSIERANILQNLGEAYHQLDNHQKGLLYLSERMQMAQKFPFADQKVEASVYRLAGRSAFQIEELKLAESIQTKGLDLWKKTGDDAQISYSLDALALTLREQKKYKQAVNYYEELKLRHLAAKRQSEVLRTFSNIGYSHYMDGNRQEALRNLEESLSGLQSTDLDANSTASEQAIAVDVGGQSSAAKGFDKSGLISMNLTFIARIHEDLGQFSKALSFYEQKIKLLDQLTKVRKDGAKAAVVEERLITLNNRGFAAIEAGRLEDARQDFRTATLAAKEFRNEPITSSDEVINLASWVRVELRLIALGMSSGGETVKEAKARLKSIEEAIQKDSKSNSNRTKWEPLSGKLKILQTAMAFAEESRAGRDSQKTDLAKSILLTAEEFASLSLGTSSRQTEYASFGYQLGLSPKAGGLKTAMLEARRSATTDPLSLPSWYYHSSNAEANSALEAIEGQVKGGFTLHNLYEIKRTMQTITACFDSAKSDPEKSLALLRGAHLFEQSFRNALKTPAQSKTSKAPPPGLEVSQVIGRTDVILNIFDDLNSIRIAAASGQSPTTWRNAMFTQVEQVRDLLPTGVKRIYFSCYGNRCDLLRKALTKEGVRISVVASPLQIPNLLTLRKMGRSSVIFAGQKNPEFEPKVMASLPDVDVHFASGTGWQSVLPAATESNIIVVTNLLSIGYEKPWNSEFISPAQDTWPVKTFIGTGRRYNSAIVLPFVRGPSGSTDRSQIYNFLSVWSEEQGVPSVFINELNASLASPRLSPQDHVLLSRQLEELIRSPGLETPQNFVRVGDPGLSEDEATTFAKEHLFISKDLGLDFRDDGDYIAAKRNLMEALQYAEITKNTPEIHTINEALVKTLFVARDYQAAYFFQKKQLAILMANHAPDEKVAEAEMQAGILATRSNQASVARQHLDKAKSFYSKDQDDQKLGQIMHYVGLSYESEGDYQKTVSSYQEAKDLYDRAGIRSDAAQKILDIGNIYKERLSNLPVALDYYEQAYQAFAKIGQQEKLASVMIDQANTLIAMGETRRAIHTLENQVLVSIDSTKNPSLWMRAAQIVGVAYYQIGMYQESQNYITLTKEKIPLLPNAGANASATIDVENLNAMNLEKLGRHSEALGTFKVALQMSRNFKLRGKEAMLLNNIGFWTREAGDASTSVGYFQQALAIDRDLKSEADEAYDLRNLAMSWTLLGDLTQAETAAKQSLEMSRRLRIPHNEAYSLFALAEIELKKNHNTEAVTYYKEAKNVASSAFLQDFVWRADAASGKVLAQQSKHKEAVESYESSIKIIESLRAGLASESSRTGFASDRGVQDVYAGIVRSLMELGRVEDAWRYSERGRARAFIDALGSKTNSYGDPQLTAEIEHIAKLKGDIELLERRLATTAKDGPDILKLQEKLLKTSLDRQERIRSTVLKWPKAESFLGISRLDLSLVQSRLGDHAALLEYMVLEEQTAYWIIYQGQIKGGLLPNGRKVLSPLINQYRELMQNFAAVKASAQDLSSSILKTPLAMVPDSATDLVIVPHSELHYLPFASLPIDSDGGYLIDQYSLSYLESAEMLRFLPKNPQAIRQTSHLAAFANPNKGTELDLPFAEREVRAIQRSFKNNASLFGTQATTSSFKLEVAKATIVHFAGHGEFNEQNPAASRLLFAKEEDLTVSQILELQMPVSLVTLSACETGLGKLSAGDEMVGFNRALFFAGAESIVSSLWRVSDVASSVMIKRFYRALIQGKPRAEALQYAQLTVRQYYNHPAYWSAFKLSGIAK